MSVAYQMPVRLELAQKIGPRMFRKTILKAGRLVKGLHDVIVDRSYMQELVNNFNAGIKDTVTVQLGHNDDVEKTRGQIKGLELTSTDELVGVFETSNDGAALFDKYPYLGCSVSIDPVFKRADGRTAGPTLLHVAATTDPEIGGLGNWLALSSEYDEVIELTASPESPAPAVVKQETTEPAAGGTVPEGDPVASLTDEQIAKLLKLVEDDGGSAPAAEANTEDDRTQETAEVIEPEFTEAELAAMAAPVEETATAETPELIAASHDHDEALQLANARIDAQAMELAKIRRERDLERFNAEKDQLNRTFGLPKDVIELARPLLEGSDNRLELSSGKKVDAGQVMREVLKQLGQRQKALDLGAEYGTADADDDLTRRTKSNEEFFAQVGVEYPRKGI